MIAVDLQTMTLDEVEKIEDAAGVSFGEIMGLKGNERNAVLGKARVLRAFAWIALRREDPEATWEDAGNVTFTDLSAIRDRGGATPPPPPPAGTEDGAVPPT